LWTSSCFAPPAVARRSSRPRRRADRSRRRPSAIAAALDRFAVLRASRRCPPRPSPWPETLDQGPRRRVRRRPPPLAAAGLCSPPPAACSCPRPPDRDPMDRSKPRRPQTAAAARSRSNGSRSTRPGQLGQTHRQPWQFCRKAPEFLIFTKIPFHLRSFLTV
jgi:hypothetical protein